MDASEFETKYHIAPQVFVNRVAVNAALAARLSEFEEDLAIAKADVAATKGWESSQDQAILTEGAAAENRLAAATEQVHAITTSRDEAIAFAEGEIDFASLRGSLGAVAQRAIDTGAVDPDGVRAAVQAALA